MANNKKCVLCGEPGEPCGLCPDEPAFCSEHFEEHRARVHADRTGRTVDDALTDALGADGLDHD